MNKRFSDFVLMFVLSFVFALTLSVNGLPLWMYIIGIFGPMWIWYIKKPHESLKGTKLEKYFLSEE